MTIAGSHIGRNVTGYWNTFPTRISRRRSSHLDTRFASIVMTAIDQILPRVRLSLVSPTPGRAITGDRPRYTEIDATGQNRRLRPSRHARASNLLSRAHLPTYSINSVCDLRTETWLGSWNSLSADAPLAFIETIWGKVVAWMCRTIRGLCHIGTENIMVRHRCNNNFENDIKFCEI